MDTQVLVAAAPAFVAALVEFVEALTIVLAVGVTRQWRSTLIGVAAAAATLTVLVGIFGTAIVMFVPIELLRLIIGTLLLVFGLQWPCKAILRASGAAAKHDEDAIYSHEVAQLADEPAVPASGMDWISFTVAFKGVLLEGLEVAFIVITFGASAGQLGPAALGAAAAGVLVVLAGVGLNRPLARVPENGLKFAVGLMLVTFGTFWAGEGLGIEWPLGDAVLFVLLSSYLLASLIGVWAVRDMFGGRRARARATQSVGD